MSGHGTRRAHLGAEEGGQEQAFLPEGKEKEPGRQYKVLLRLVSYGEPQSVEERGKRTRVRPEPRLLMFEFVAVPTTENLVMAGSDVDSRRPEGHSWGIFGNVFEVPEFVPEYEGGGMGAEVGRPVAQGGA